MPRPILCEISTAALHHNLEQAKRYFSQANPRRSEAKTWAVVKADAYGHGLANACAAFSRADGLALVEFDYAMTLRKYGWTKPILMLEGPFDINDVEKAREYGLSLAIHHPDQLQWLQQTYPQVGSSQELDIWLKVNSGMNRLGFVEEHLEELCQFIRERKTFGVNQVGLMTHFANSDVSVEIPGGHVTAMEQAERFQQMLATLNAYSSDLHLSLANSSATMAYADIAAEISTSNGKGELWIRPGVMLYGATPFGDLNTQSAQAMRLRPAMALKTAVIGIQNLQPGDAVGYGSRFIAQKPMRIGVIAAGYADGYPRLAPDGTPVLVKGQRTRIVGRVSMDMMTIDLTGLDADMGAEVELWGANLSIDEVASYSNTIGYELMCAVAQRVPKKTIKGYLA